MIFSVLIPAYKKRFLQEAIESVLRQSYASFELIIVDDASPEDLESVVNGFDDTRVKYYRNEKNCGAENVVDNWNICLSYSSGDYVICMGDDDRLLPNCLEEYATLIEKHPGFNVYHGKTEIINEESKIIEFQESRPEFESTGEMLYNQFRYQRIQFLGDFCISREWLIKNKGYVKFRFGYISDWATANLAMEDKGIINSQSAVFQYRRFDRTISNSQDARQLITAFLDSYDWYTDYIQNIRKVCKDSYAALLDEDLYRQFHLKVLYYYIIKDVSEKRFFSSLFWWTKNARRLSLSPVFVAGMVIVNYMKGLMKK